MSIWKQRLTAWHAEMDYLSQFWSVYTKNEVRTVTSVSQTAAKWIEKGERENGMAMNTRRLDGSIRHFNGNRQDEEKYDLER